ncbi:hypothetical protein F220043C3_34780 [Enterocloster asparagiformis]
MIRIKLSAFTKTVSIVVSLLPSIFRRLPGRPHKTGGRAQTGVHANRRAQRPAHPVLYGTPARQFARGRRFYPPDGPVPVQYDIELFYHDSGSGSRAAAPFVSIIRL